MTDLHMEHTMAMESPGLSSSAWAWVLIGFIINISAPFIGFIASSARVVTGSEAVINKANAMLIPSIVLETVLFLFIFVTFVFLLVLLFVSEQTHDLALVQP
jgi:hypothetical protein